MRTLLKNMAGLSALFPLSALAQMGITVSWSPAATTPTPVPAGGPIVMALTGLLITVIAFRLFPKAARGGRNAIVVIGVGGLMLLAVGSREVVSGIPSVTPATNCTDSVIYDGTAGPEFLENTCGGPILLSTNAVDFCAPATVEYNCFSDASAPGGSCDALVDIEDGSRLENNEAGILPKCD